MKKSKFEELDRKQVITAVEDHYGIKLRQVGRRPTWRRDESGKSWWVLGGSVEFHGISREMMEAEEQDPSGGMIVVACVRRMRNSADADMEVFAGPVEQLVKAKNKLSQSQTGDYKFEHRTLGAGTSIQIKGKDSFPIMCLKKIDALSYEAAKKEKDRETDKIIKRAEKHFLRMTPKQQQQFLQDLQCIRQGRELEN